MKYLYLFIFIAALVISCSKDPESIANGISAKVCKTISSSQSSKKFTEAEKIYSTELSKLKPELRKIVKGIADAAIGDCIRSLNLKKNMSAAALNPDIKGNGGKYIKLRSRDWKIELIAGENPAFSVLLNFYSPKPYTSRNQILDTECKIFINDDDGNPIADFVFYPTPDMKKLIDSGNGEANMRIYLMPVFSDAADNPLSYAKEAILKLEKLAALTASIEIKTASSAETESEIKVYEDLLDKMDKKQNK